MLLSYLHRLILPNCNKIYLNGVQMFLIITLNYFSDTVPHVDNDGIVVNQLSIIFLITIIIL